MSEKEVLTMVKKEDEKDGAIPFPSAQNQRTFALAIIAEKIGDRETTQIQAKGKGMPLAEAIFYIESWLETVKEKLNEGIKKNFTLGTE